MVLTARALNRTLLLRQHLLARADLDPMQMVEHLVGLQAQETLPPYLGLAARLTDVDPQEVSTALEERRLVRVSTLRGAIHLHTPGDAALLRSWTLPVLERQNRTAQNVRPARDIPAADLERALAQVLAPGPRPLSEIGTALAKAFPGVPAAALGGRARNTGLVQVPPRGLWKRRGGVVYDTVERWTGLPSSPPDGPAVAAIVRRYLAAFGPASAADVTAWSGITGLGPVLRGMTDLATYEDETGRTLWDLPGLPVASGEERAPVRLLGTYDNLWLAHAGRDRVTSPEARAAWAGDNGGVAGMVLADGYVAGLWRPVDGRVEVSLLRPFTREETRRLGEEVERTEAFLAR